METDDALFVKLIDQDKILLRLTKEVWNLNMCTNTKWSDLPSLVIYFYFYIVIDKLRLSNYIWVYFLKMPRPHQNA